ncbi:MAG: VCBS repeat-containing protein [Myxococcales bacterium]|nr:VCBS repeat-containing protein [Myxococcales bacterium]
MRRQAGVGFPRTWAGCGLVATVGACGTGGSASDDGSATDGSGISVSITLTGATDSATTDASGTVDTTAATTGVACPAEEICGEAGCCGPGQVCVDGACVADCGDAAPCGPDQICCGDAELCYAGACVVPGDPCRGLACATNTTMECDADEICDAELGLCVPNLADPSCAFQPEEGVFDPVPRFTWGVRQARPCTDGCQVQEACVIDVCQPTWTHHEIAADDFPEWHQVVMTPMVADLDGDCVPEIVFNSYRNSTYTTDGILRVLRGDTGVTVWSLGDDAYRTDPSAHPAIGDLDLDGSPEIVAPGEGQQLLAVRADGTPLWISQNYNFSGVKSGSPAIANLDGAGTPEIVFGRSVFDSAGVVVWQAANGATGSTGGFGPLSCVADLDDDARPELIAGGTAYAFTGTVGVDFAGSPLWTASPGEGYCGIADFDLDGDPEVAVVNSGNIYLYDGQTGATLAAFAIPEGGAGGPPNIADFDGDGRPDLGTAAADRYVVVTYDGAGWAQLWTADTKDGSSQRTGSSVFDFDGDGRSEVIYADEWYLRIYPGTEPGCPGGAGCDGIMTDDELLFIDINSSRTRTENPVVADVDGDFKAEIIVSTNNESAQGAIGDAGIEVFEDRLDNWVATLPIWNQHTYHVTNVAADATIPPVEAPNWSTPAGSPYNSYRRNTQGELETLCAPDLVPTDLMVDTLACPTLDMSVRILNQGCLGVGAGVNVAFYDGDLLLGVVQTTAAIPAGTAETVELVVMDAVSPPFEITVVADDDGMGNGALNECRDDNNATVPSEWCNPIG